MGIRRGKWQGHLKAAETSDMSLSAYAAEHGINVRRLYEARYVDTGTKAAKVRQSSAIGHPGTRHWPVPGVATRPHDFLRTSHSIRPTVKGGARLNA